MPTTRYNRVTNQFVLTGDEQAVVFSPDVKSIDVYSVNPGRNLAPLRESPIPGGYRYTDGSSVHGAALLERWREAGPVNRDQVIWDELQRWFDSYFPASGKAET